MIISYIVFNVLNVIIQTVKSIATIKCNKWVAAIINAIAYGLYTYIIYITSNDNISLWFKIITVALANLIGVFIVKWTEEKNRKDKLWKVEFTVDMKHTQKIDKLLSSANIPHNYISNVGTYTIFNAYCATQKQSIGVREIIENFNAKYFVSETKFL